MRIRKYPDLVVASLPRTVTCHLSHLSCYSFLCLINFNLSPRKMVRSVQVAVVVWVLCGFFHSSRQRTLDIEFEVKQIPENPLFKPSDRLEHAERNTSAEYGWWKTMDVVWIEWPGNITTFEPEFPLLKWGKELRAKLIQNSCNNLLGMEFKAYAYKYVHLTWGPFRMTACYCPPMKVPREKLKGLAKDPTSTVLSVSDFEFVDDALLVIIEDRFVLRIGQLEASYLEQGTHPIPSLWTLSYDVAKGISGPINKLVTQSCCKKKSTVCLFGETVLAYNEGSSDFKVFLSQDSGFNFRKLSIEKPSEASSILHSVLHFPGIQSTLVIHGNETHAHLETLSTDTGTGTLSKISLNGTRKTHVLNIRGKLQANQLGEETSLVLWDECRVWYSHNAGMSTNEALFYIHTKIDQDVNSKKRNGQRWSKPKHRIRSTHCSLGKSTRLAFDSTGKLGLIDSNNYFFYGIDTKSSEFALIGTNVDMSLLMKGKERSIVPFFDFNNRPKLMYPPRYLVIDDPIVHADHYPKRLGMRLFPRSVFPSEFIPPYFEEHIPSRFRPYGFAKCQTSSISVDFSISQKAKLYTVEQGQSHEFIMEFKSFSSHSNQLNVEPRQHLKYLKVTVTRLDFLKMGARNYYYFKYKVTVNPKSGVQEGSLHRLNFYTKKSIRCVHQPQVTIWIQIGKSSVVNEDEDQYPVGNDVDTPKRAADYIQTCQEDSTEKKIPVENQVCSYAPFSSSVSYEKQFNLKS